MPNQTIQDLLAARQQGWIPPAPPPAEPTTLDSVADIVRYFMGPHLMNRVEAVSNLAGAMTPTFGTDYGQEAADEFRQGNYGRGIAKEGLGMAQAALDAIPASKLPLAVFAGLGARTADMQKLAEAADMTKKGWSSDAVVQDTGWFKGNDGHWRFEIPDQNSHLYSFALDKIKNGEELRLGDAGVFPHPALYEAYPQLREVTIHNRVNPDNYGTSFGGNIGLATNRPRSDIESTLLHEMQHEIQNIEGTAKGGQKAMFAMTPDQIDATLTHLDIMENAKWLMNEMASKGLTLDEAVESIRKQGIVLENDAIYYARSTAPGDPWMDESIKRETERLLRAEDGGYEGYRRLAGEVEARNVQYRANQAKRDPTYLEEVPPWYSMDVQPPEQILRGVEPPRDIDIMLEVLRRGSGR